MNWCTKEIFFAKIGTKHNEDMYSWFWQSIDDQGKLELKSNYNFIHAPFWDISVNIVFH